MKDFKIITRTSIVVATAAIVIAAFNIFGLYESKKHQTMEIVRECAVNADILEMISRMKSGDKAAQSFIRLNSIIEQAQQKDGLPGNADTLRTSLSSLMSLGLEFDTAKPHTDPTKLDSIFNEELHRHGLYPAEAWIAATDTNQHSRHDYWSVEYGSYPKQSHGFKARISPIPGKVLTQMWGIIIPLVIVVSTFAFLSSYLIRYVKKLRTIEQMKDDFTHNMTHELKTPVAVAYSAADSMLRYYDQSDEVRNKRFLRIIIQRLANLSGMIEKILSMSMERFKALELNREKVELKPLVDEVAGMIRLKAEKPVDITIDIPENTSVVSDSLHLGNVLSNLMDNAVKYSGDSVAIRIRADKHSITVEDNGIGIPKDSLPYIFDKFYRIHSGDRYEVGGYGLGLFYVKQIIRLQGWDIRVTSVPERGTKFIITTNGDEER